MLCNLVTVHTLYAVLPTCITVVAYGNLSGKTYLRKDYLIPFLYIHSTHRPQQTIHWKKRKLCNTTFYVTVDTLQFRTQKSMVETYICTARGFSLMYTR